MGEIVKTLGFVVVVLFIVSCATKVANTIAHTESVPSKTEVLDTFSSEQLAQGQAYFEESCTRCHKLFEPESRDAEKWNNVLKRMLPKTELTQEESTLVRAYLIANSK